MLSLTGQLISVYTQPGGVSKKTGESYDAREKVQILCDVPLEDGGSKKDLLLLSVSDPTLYKSYIGKQISVPVGAYSNDKTVGFYAIRGSIPRLVLDSSSQPSPPSPPSGGLAAAAAAAASGLKS